MNSPPPEYRLTSVIHLSTNRIWRQWCRVASKSRLEKAIQISPGPFSLGTHAFWPLSQHIWSLAPQKPPFWGDHMERLYRNIDRYLSSPSCLSPQPRNQTGEGLRLQVIPAPSFWVTASDAKWTQMSCACWVISRLQINNKINVAVWSHWVLGKFVCYTALGNSNICSSDEFVFQPKIPDSIVQNFPQHCIHCPLNYWYFFS